MTSLKWIFGTPSDTELNLLINEITRRPENKLLDFHKFTFLKRSIFLKNPEGR